MSIHCNPTSYEKQDRHGLPVLNKQYEPLPPGVDLQYWSHWFPTSQGPQELTLVRWQPEKEIR